MPDDDDDLTPTPTIDDGRADPLRLLRADNDMKAALIREQKREILLLTDELNERRIENDKLKLAVREGRERARALAADVRALTAEVQALRGSRAP